MGEGPLRAERLSSARPVHESLEELARPGKVGGQLFRVALHGDDETVRRLDALDGAVVASSRLPQSRRQLADRLVMQAVDTKLLQTGRASELRLWIDLDRVSEMVAAE